MRSSRFVVIVLVIVFSSFVVKAQRPEVTITLNELFFDALLDSTFNNFDPPQFSISERSNAECGVIKIVREMSGVRTSVRFRDGRVNVPLAFLGNYSVPFVGCVDYAGWADSTMTLEFDSGSQKLVGRIQVNTVNMNGASGVGGTLIAGLVQTSIDKKMNPVEILSLEKVSFAVPVQSKGTLRMRAVSIIPEIVGNSLNVRIAYDFLKG